MPNDKELYHVTFSSPELTTVGDYLDDKNSPAYMYNTMPEKFLSIVGEDQLTNRQRIESSFKTPDERAFIGAKATDLPIKVGTLLYLEFDKVNNASFVTEGIEIVSTDEPAFKAAQLAKLEGDRGYYQVIKPIAGQIQNGSLKEQFPACTVWIWCRSLSPRSDEEKELTGEFFDLTPFVQTVTTNMGKNGGNFQITLPPLVCELDDQGKWALKKNIIQYETLQGQEYLAEDQLFHIEDEEIAPNKFLFHKIIKSNDLIFIRFETLEIEKKQRYEDAQQYLIDKANVADRIYDMIGLVDRNNQIIAAGSNEVSINISGRDLSKLFIEDGTYFYALENSQGLLKFAGQSTQKNTQVNRIFGDGALNFIGLYMFTSIEYIFKFIIQQLANISIVPSNLFTSYGDRRNTRYNETERKFNNPNAYALGKNDIRIPYKKIHQPDLANGIWQIVKLVIDESVAGRRLTDSSFSTAQGSLLNFIRSAAQEPLVEFYMDTYGDMYHLIVRKPPYDQKALISLIEGRVNTETGNLETPPAIIDIEAEDILDERLFMDDSEVYSWYSFFPKNNLMGDAQNYSMAYLGALFFEEYAQVFGTKAFNQSHPYIPYVPKNKKGNESLDLYEKQAISDLKYVVETNQYLPFTRKGTLTLNRDRRIKIGNIIRYKPTGEIFFVDSVQHKHVVNESTIDAVTVVNVSRGMIEQLIYGTHLQNESGERRFVSYFNLIDTRLSFEEKTIEVPYTTTKKTGTRTVEVAKKGYQSFNLSINNPDLANASVMNITEPKMVTGVQYLEKYNSFPQSKALFIKFINAVVAKGYKVTLLPLATNRTYAEQAALKKQNIGNASAGHSKHEKGRAIDITITNQFTGEVYSKHTSEVKWRLTGVPLIANQLGLRWGGVSNDGTFGSYVDRVHYEIPDLSNVETEVIEEDIMEEVTEMRKQKTMDREGIFKNFKVNKFTFNFFLKNRQFDPQYRKVTSRQIFNSDAQGTMPEVVITAKKKLNK